MGLAERDYYRAKQAPISGPTASPRRWSVTTWLIIVCTVIFVVDHSVLLRFTRPVRVSKPQAVVPELVENESRIPAGDRLQRFADRAGPPWQPGKVYELQTWFRHPEGNATLYRLDYFVGTPFLQSWLQFTTAQALISTSKTVGLTGFEFWRFIGYQFLHADIMHLALNMLGLFFFGPVVEDFLGRKRYLAFYLLCGLFGALLYMLLNVGGIFWDQVFLGTIPPPFLPNSPFSPLIGASASVFGVVLASAYLAPNEVVLIFYVLPMRLRTFAYLLVGVAIVRLLMQSQNAGGEAAHLGGALAGAWFIRRPHHLHDFFDFLGRADPTSRMNRARRAQSRGIMDTAEIDRILEKIRTQGMGALSKSERQSLHDASRKDR